jgi:hypothetical protein
MKQEMAMATSIAGIQEILPFLTSSPFVLASLKRPHEMLTNQEDSNEEHEERLNSPS